MQSKRQVAANPQTKPTDLGRESADNNWQLPSTPPSLFIILFITITHTDTPFTVPQRLEGSLDLGTAERVQQPVPKTANRNSSRNKRTPVLYQNG